MKAGKFHVEIDEVTYDRQELEEFYNQHKQHIMNFVDYQNFIFLSLINFNLIFILNPNSFPMYANAHPL